MRLLALMSFLSICCLTAVMIHLSVLPCTPHAILFLGWCMCGIVAFLIFQNFSKQKLKWGGGIAEVILIFCILSGPFILFLLGFAKSDTLIALQYKQRSLKKV